VLCISAPCWLLIPLVRDVLCSLVVAVILGGVGSLCELLCFSCSLLLRVLWHGVVCSCAVLLFFASFAFGSVQERGVPPGGSVFGFVSATCCPVLVVILGCNSLSFLMNGRTLVFSKKNPVYNLHVPQL
jgi:hypothetical protein